MKRLFKGTRCGKTIALLMAIALLSAFLPVFIPTALAAVETETLNGEVIDRSAAPKAAPEKHDNTALNIAAVVSLVALSGIIFAMVTTKKYEFVPEINESI